MTIAVQNLAEVIQNSLAITAPEFGAVEDDLDIVESELMKKGTMAYFDIDWDSAYDHSVKILGSGAHIDAVAAASTAVLQKGDIEDLPKFAQLLKQLLDENWEAIHPVGPKFERLKKMRVQELLDTIPKRLEKEPLKEDGFEEIINDLVKTSDKLGLDSDALRSIRVEKPEVSPEAGETVVPQPAKIGGSEQTASSGFTADLDAKGRNQLKRDVIALAERIEVFRPLDPTPYYLRAFAATIELKTAPEADASGMTTMNAMPSEIADPFERALGSPSIQVLKQLEQRLLNSPDWFDGQAIAYQLADALNMPMIANAVRHRVQNRITQLPAFAEIKYSNGTDFLTTHAETILMPADSGGSAAPADTGGGEDAPNRAEKVEAIMREKGLAQALEYMEKELNNARSAREAAIINLDRAAFLAEHGLVSLAAESLKILSLSFENSDVKNWDEPLFKRLQKLKDTIAGGENK